MAGDMQDMHEDPVFGADFEDDLLVAAPRHGFPPSNEQYTYVLVGYVLVL
jgi:hypothetical protein